MISRVEPNHVDLVWGILAPLLEKGLSRGQGDETTPAHIKAAIAAGDSQMWVVHEGEAIQAAIVLSVTDSAVRKVWVELLAGTDMDSWIDDLERLVADFRDLVGATCIEASCRPGLAKYLKERGWQRKATIMAL